MSSPRTCLAGTHLFASAQGSRLKATTIPAGTATREMDGLRAGRIDSDPGFPLDTGRPAVLNASLPRWRATDDEDDTTSATRPTPPHLHHSEGLRRDGQGAGSGGTPLVLARHAQQDAGHGGGRTSTRGVSWLCFHPHWIWTGRGLFVVVLVVIVVRRRPPELDSPSRLSGIRR
ncbi:hypothetical protein DFH09DRAFT_1067254 [Mycena vulgaris]|nr:hypothetical protein DFH09DRAFT_1067254 [Mycena vulgaris]